MGLKLYVEGDDESFDEVKLRPGKRVYFRDETGKKTHVLKCKRGRRGRHSDKKLVVERVKSLTSEKKKG